MDMLKDYEIAEQTKIEPIIKVAKKMNLKKEDLILYGDYKAKIKENKEQAQNAKLVLVTSINPTPYGEGKTTVAIGLHDALRKLKVNSLLTLREPSLGPVFGIKGGATGGGYAQVIPMDDINLHFNGDFHAITTANNLISSMIDNHLYHGNLLNLKEIYFTRALDLNDRALRNIIIKNKEEREEQFTITAACEIMSTLCMSKDLEDLRERLDKIIIGKNTDNEYVYLKELHITGSLLALLKDALKPNLIQTLENNPVLMHCGPFANIAPGCNSIKALKYALNHSDYVITEAGFGFDLGGFKFLDIVCRNHDLTVSSIVLVVTIKALKHHGNNNLQKGMENLDAHLENISKCKIPFIVTLNQHVDDQKEDIKYIKKYVEEKNIPFVINTVFKDGGKGATKLAKEVLKLENENMYYLYENNTPIKTKIEIVCKEIFHASTINYTQNTLDKIANAEKLFSNLPICIAKTQYSISDDKNKLGYPKNYEITVKDIRIFNGAGFITVYLGDILTMPGLSKEPAALSIDVINDEIKNIF